LRRIWFFIDIVDKLSSIKQTLGAKTPLTPKGRRSIFSKKSSNLPFLAQEAQIKNKIKSFFGILTVRSCPRLLGEHGEKVSKTLTTRITIL
jgi:hypothetical protein